MARKPGDHGEAQDAIDYLLDSSQAPGEETAFLRCWREGDLAEWPDYYEWLDKREAEDKAWRAAERKRLKGFHIRPAKSGARSPSEASASALATDDQNPTPPVGRGEKT